MNEKLIDIADSLTAYIKKELESRDKTSTYIKELGVTLTAFSSGDLYIVQVGNIVKFCGKTELLFGPVLNAIKIAIKDPHEVSKSLDLAKYTRDGIKEQTKDIRDTLKRIMHNLREIEACASAIPCSVKNNGNQDVYDLRQVILKNRFCVTDELEHIKEIVTEMF